MQMSRNHPVYRLAFQTFFEHGAPVLLYAVGKDASVDDRPTITIAQQPDVDVIQSAHHRHANPKNTIGDFCVFSRPGHLVFESVRERVEASLRHVVYHMPALLFIGY
jgi:hypothetical protein